MLLSLLKYKHRQMRQFYNIHNILKHITNTRFRRLIKTNYKYITNAFFFRKLYFRTMLMYLNNQYLVCASFIDLNFFYLYNFMAAHLNSVIFYYKYVSLY